MNKQDAIWILEEVKMFDDSMYSFKPAYLEALDMAIEALKTDAIDGIKPCSDCQEFDCYGCDVKRKEE